MAGDLEAYVTAFEELAEPCDSCSAGPNERCSHRLINTTQSPFIHPDDWNRPNARRVSWTDAC